MKTLFSLVMLCFLSIACASCAYNTYLQVTPQEKQVAGEPTLIPYAIQRETAVHEAGHAIAIVGMFGPEYVREVSVHLLCCTKPLHDNLGYTQRMNVAMSYSAESLRQLMMTAFAGRAAEIVIFGRPTEGAASDIAMANIVAWHLVNTSGLLAAETGSLMIRNPADAPQEMRDRVDQELSAANARTLAFVQANEQLIRQLADAILAQPVENYSRTLDMKEFQAFIAGKDIVLPEDPTAQDSVIVPENKK